MSRILLCILMTISFSVFASKIDNEKDVPYIDPATSGFDPEKHVLNIFYPKDVAEKKEVFIFLHGGSWSSGDKNIYRFMAKKLARRGIVTVVVNYRLSPQVNYQGMAEDCAHAVAWVHKNISTYGGDPSKITLGGHSAGGHLAALVYLKTLKDLDLENPIVKVLLIDAFGLDMVNYFKAYHNDYARGLYKVFGDRPDQWREASPIYFVKSGATEPFLIMIGSRTFPTIQESSKAFHEKLKDNGITTELQVIKGKKHIGMIAQFFFRKKPYERIMPFLKS